MGNSHTTLLQSSTRISYGPPTSHSPQPQDATQEPAHKESVNIRRQSTWYVECKHRLGETLYTGR